jgi:hypothetical protein
MYATYTVHKIPNVCITTQHHSTQTEQRNQITHSPVILHNQIANTKISTTANTKSHVRHGMEMQLQLLKAQIYERSFEITFTRRRVSSDVQVHPTA